MKRWLETHRRRKAAREALARALAQRPRRYRLLPMYNFLDILCYNMASSSQPQ